MAQKPYFYLSLTDGDLNHAPSQEEMQQGYQRADQHGLAQKALANFAREMMKNAEGGKIEKGLAYNKIPDGYSIWFHQRSETSRKDWFIYGHPGHIKFHSFAQLATHLNHLQKLEQPPGTCDCKVCEKVPLTANTLVRRDWVPAGLVTPISDDAPPPPSSEGDANAAPGASSTSTAPPAPGSHFF